MKLVILTITALIATCASAAAQSAEDGEKVFRKCAACHQVGEGAKNRAGPVLTDVIGRPAGSFADYEYSTSMLQANAAGLIWTEDLIFSYVADPKTFLRNYLGDDKAKAKMTFRLKPETDRRAVIAYLASFKTAGLPPEDGFCIVNATSDTYLFATETREGDRQLAELTPGERLCSAKTQAEDGVASVFKDADGFEGCSRIVPVGAAEDLLEYAEFDRCGWGSHDS